MQGAFVKRQTQKDAKNPGCAWMRLLRVWDEGVWGMWVLGSYWKRRSSSSNFSWVISASAWVPRRRTMCVQRP